MYKSIKNGIASSMTGVIDPTAYFFNSLVILVFSTTEIVDPIFGFIEIKTLPNSGGDLVSPPTTRIKSALV